MDRPTPSAEPPTSPAVLRAQAAHPAEMAALAVELAGRVTDAASLRQLILAVLRAAVRVVPGADLAGVTARFQDMPFTAASSDDRVLVVDESQYAAGDGPCLLALRTNSRVSMSWDEVAARWPLLADSARSNGVTWFLAVPLLAHDHPIGALNLYRTGIAMFADPDPDLLVVLTEYLNRGLTDYVDNVAGELRERALRTALTEATVVDRAVGVLMMTLTLNPGQASARLHAQARTRRTTVAAEATRVLAAAQP